ncbi:MAG: hypothetical protein O3A97_00645, partial [Proteobacteria bacterium]|nr:hypothetical protein [Pseudomonadota bacterium]
ALQGQRLRGIQRRLTDGKGADMIHPPNQDESHLNPHGNPQRFKFKPKRFSSDKVRSPLMASSATQALNHASLDVLISSFSEISRRRIVAYVTV